MKKSIILIVSVFFLLSCQEEVVLDLKEIERVIVVEAIMINPTGNVTVALSYSQSFYDTSAVELISGAEVSISGPNIAPTTLAQVSEGVYHYFHLPLKANETYQLTIQTNNEIIEAEAILPSVVKVSSVTQVPNPFAGPDSINLFVNYFDIPGEDNFFRLKVNKFGRVPTSEYYLVDDSFGKDGIITSPVYYKNFAKGDTAIVELFHLSKATWSYLSGLSDNRGGSFNSISPGNPETNMPDGVIGFFAGYGYWADTIVIQ